MSLTYPYPGAFSFLKGKKCFLWRSKLLKNKNLKKKFKPGQIIEIVKGNGLIVGTSNGAILVSNLQLEDEKEMAGDTFCKKHNIQLGTCFEGKT